MLLILAISETFVAKFTNFYDFFCNQTYKMIFSVKMILERERKITLSLLLHIIDCIKKNCSSFCARVKTI